MRGWVRFNLEQLSEFITKGSTPTTFGFKWVDNGIPFLRSECVTDDGFNRKGLSFISSEAHHYMERSKVIDGDILISITGNVGRIAIFPKELKEGNINQHIARVRINNFKICNKYFIYYQLIQDSFRQYYNGIVTGAAYPQLSLKQIRETPVFLPAIAIQNKIASILLAYDHLIENNLKRIKLLEELAQRTYAEWFVKFRVNGEQLEVNANTGSPNGWDEKEFQFFGEIITGKTPSTLNEAFFNGSVPFVKTPDMSGFPYVLETTQKLSDLGANSQIKKFIPKNSLMVSCIGSTGVGLYALASQDCQTNQQINSISFYEEYYPFYFYCLAKKLKPMLDALGSNGVTMTNVNKGKFEKMKAIYPPKNILVDFHNKFKNNFKLILNLQKQNRLLKESRDILLPRIMSGEIGLEEVKEVALAIAAEPKLHYSLKK